MPSKLAIEIVDIKSYKRDRGTCCCRGGHITGSPNASGVNIVLRARCVAEVGSAVAVPYGAKMSRPRLLGSFRALLSWLCVRLNLEDTPMPDVSEVVDIGFVV